MLKLGILDVEGTKYTLKIGREYLVGRKSNELSHDIEIDDQSVDIKHSIIDLTENSSPQIFDICSKHGTFVDYIKIPRFKSIPLAKTSKIRFGNVDTYLQLLFEGDSGFLEERLNSPTEDTTEIICNSPEHIISSGSRLKNSLKNSLTSTPNQSTATTSLPSASKSDHNFVIPSCLPRSSIGSNTSARSVDSFYIPETQCADVRRSRTNNSTDISFNSNTSKKNNNCTTGDDDDDFFIPETQDVVNCVPAAIPLSNHARLAFPSDDVNETLSEENRIPSSQFRICTQDFNGSQDDLSNQSDDILANVPLSIGDVPLSMVIPTIKHDIVQVDDFIKNDEDDDNEMSALQWSRKTFEDNADGAVTPDVLFDFAGSATSDLSKVIRKSADKALSQCSTPDIFAIPEEPQTAVVEGKPTEVNKDKQNVTIENKEPETLITAAIIDEKNNKVTEQVNIENNDSAEEDNQLSPTQAFFKPIPINKSIGRLSLPPLLASEDNFDLLPETQVFAPTIIKSKPILPHAPTKPQFIPVNDHEKSSFSTKPPDSGKNHVFALPKASPKPRSSINPQASPKLQVSPKPQTPLKSPSSTVPEDDEDDLPPTQVFVREEHVPQPIITNIFSSTLVDCGIQQLSENSFKTKFNKLLDSDDDEMDEIIAPDLVKKMRQSLDKPQQPVLFAEIPSTPQKQEITPSRSSKQEEKTASEKKTSSSTVTPDNNNFRIPAKVTKTTSKEVPAISIDNFLLTPDFLGKEFSKNSQLQREAEVNWRNMVLKKRNKALFGDEKDHNDDDNLENVDTDDSQDSFGELLPKRGELRSKSVNQTPKSTEKIEEEVECGRLTRRRSTFKAISVKTKDIDKKEPKTRGRKKSETKTTNTVVKDKKPDIAKEQKDSKTDKTDSSLVKDSSSVLKTDMVKDSSAMKKDSKETSSTKESNSIKKSDSSAIKESNDMIVHRDSTKSRSSSSTKSSVNTSKDSKDKIESKSKELVRERTTRNRRKVVEEPTVTTIKVEKKSSKAVKRNAEAATKSSSKASKINKLDELDFGGSRQNDDKSLPRITRLRSATDMKVDDKKVTLNKNNREKMKEDVKKQEPVKKSSTTKTTPVAATDCIDLTDSDREGKSVTKKTAKKRKSQEEHVYKISRKSSVSASQSSAESNDSDRTLRRKKKLKIAMTSCSPATRETLVRYSGRVWDYTEDPKECDVLILEAGNRTYKLLVAIARGVPVVKVNWIHEVIIMKSTDVSFEKYIFDEANFEKRHKFVMRDSLQLAKTSSLFSGMNFMMTPNITPKPDEMKDIIVCAGGTVLANIPASKDVKFYLVSENADNLLWYRYRRASPDVKVVTAISLMASVMQQSLEPLMKSIH